MSSEASQPDEGGLWVKILDLVEDYAFGKLFRVVRATLQYQRFDGRMSDPVTRINFERGDSVGVLLYDPRDDAVILVRQFRYPVYASLDPDERAGDDARQAWLLEMVAGVQDAGRTVKDVAHKELLEEAGYKVKGQLQPITTIYPSPGGTSERIHLFLGEVDRRQRAGKGGGVAAEGEDTQIVVLPFHEAMAMITSGAIRDAKTIMALQHLALRKAERLVWEPALKGRIEMGRDDPLERWLFLSAIGLPPEVTARRQAEVHAALDRLTHFLDNPPPRRANMYNAWLWGWDGAVALGPADLARAQDLYRRVYVTGGTGNTYVQEGLLNLIAATEDPASVPFWVEILDLSRPRDVFAGRRRTVALAALAHLAIQRNEPAAYAALRNAAQHVRPELRALAVHYLGRAYLDTERPLPPEVLADLSDIALHDTAFGPRFQARSILRTTGLPVPLDNPGGVYAFKVKFMWAKRIFRTIELRSEQTLDDLHFAIQQAIGWDADHLYSFYLNGQLYDQRYAFACPYEEDRPPWTDEAIIGELGLVVKHKFLYYFDYGDSHQFEVEVAGIRPQAEPGKYPRMVDSRGEAPRQYG